MSTTATAHPRASPPTARRALVPAVLGVGDLPSVELQAARLDGELFGYRAAYAPVDAVIGAEHRAESVPELTDSRYLAEQRTAAWIHGVLAEPPARPQLCLDSADRTRAPRRYDLSIREVVIAPSEWMPVGRTRVTTPLRTLLDLARCEDVLDAPLLCSLAALSPLSLEQIVAQLEARPRIPDKKRTLARLRACSPAGPAELASGGVD